MKIMFSAWVFLGAFVSVAVSQSHYDSQQPLQDTHYDSDEVSYHPSNRRHQQPRSYESPSHEDVPHSDPRHYQSLEPRYPEHEPQSYARQPRYHVVPVQYHQPEDPSYHRPQEIVYHQSPHSYQDVAPKHEESYQSSSHYPEPEEKEEEDSKYVAEEPKYTHTPKRSPSSHPAPVPVDPKLPLYFTMYEKRVIQDPMDKYGKGPWRYLTYGHGITYGSKEPGKVFEKGYGYIRALGRDHCKLPEHLCPPRDEKPFDYDGRKEPYFGYRPH